MNAAAIQLALFIIEEGIKLEPSIAAEIKALLNKADPTAADWADLRAKVLVTYESYVPATALPETLPTTPTP